MRRSSEADHRAALASRYETETPGVTAISPQWPMYHRSRPRAVQRAGLDTLREGQKVNYEMTTERGKTAATNLKVE